MSGAGGRKLPSLGIVSFQPVGEQMAGPSIRCLELARALAADARVTLLAPAGSSLPDGGDGTQLAGFDFTTYEPEGLTAMLAGYDALLLQGFTLDRQPDLGSLAASFLIIDLYVPLIFEALVHYQHLPIEEQESTQAQILMAVADRLAAGDYFLAASERQRDFWLGWLAAAGRLTPAAYRQDAGLRGLIDVVPFGLPDQPPAAGPAPVLREVHPAVSPDDKILIWGGGIYNWLDPFTPIHAVASLKERRPDVKLFFLGARHPDPNVPEMKVYDEAVNLARELGVEGTQVIFNDKWVPYAERSRYLLEADLGASASPAHIETRFSFRTRLLDCIWAGLPIVTTAGDPLSQLVAERELGSVTPPGDAESYAAAVLSLLDSDSAAERCRQNLKLLAAEMSWRQVAEPVRQRLAAVQPGTQQPERRRLSDDELWRIVSSKEDDIQRLWDMVREKEEHIGNFQAAIIEKDRQIAALEAEVGELNDLPAVRFTGKVNEITGKVKDRVRRRR